ncbi:unnamed protein product [Schistocephalus solidus]|uniref:Rod shape-determining protein MreC n=1 Tax=Schistocephalus solidus TaxID=70667 RepID=A0A183SGZ8_SCHSO|nr:unnamed protein product [Schistocephalus solidus]
MYMVLFHDRHQRLQRYNSQLDQAKSHFQVATREESNNIEQTILSQTTARAGQLSGAEVGATAGDLVYVFYVHDLAPQTRAPGFHTTGG